MATQADLDRVNAAISSGATSVSYNGRTVSLRSQSELIELRDYLMRQLNPAAATTRVIYPAVTR